jgi:hypothetical protein
MCNLKHVHYYVTVPCRHEKRFKIPTCDIFDFVCGCDETVVPEDYGKEMVKVRREDVEAMLRLLHGILKLPGQTAHAAESMVERLQICLK